MSHSKWLALMVLVMLSGFFLAMPGPDARSQKTTMVTPGRVDVAAIQSQAGSTETTPSVPSLRGHAPSSPDYDEQIGLTFTQNFNSMIYNVTAVEQTDPTLGTGPGYLLSGLSNEGYWYQVGLSYNWSPGSTPGTGFAMSFEVFNDIGDSIYPTNGGGGLLSFSGPVNAGDNVTIKLSFSSGDVIMSARDTSTGASASTSYSSFMASTFVGQPTSDANSEGFFTGLMTEWYHGEPGYQEPSEVLYSTNSSISSGWMWMDEFNANNDVVVFESNASLVSTYSANPTQLQPFSYEGITEYSSGSEFITGSSSGSTTTTSSGSVSTQTTTTTVPVTVTQTVTATVTATGTATGISTVTSTVTQQVTTTATQQVTTTLTQSPTTLTVTSTYVPPPSVTTTTETSTTTQTVSSGQLSPWSYALILAALLVGIVGGYLLRRPPGGPAPQTLPAQQG